jgi:hypothetical protein
MQNHLRLDDLLARDVDPRWFEGVAVVQLICRQLRAQNGGSGFPRAADILIGPGGSVAIAGESAGNPVQAAAHVLALMLSDDVPVRLRLAVSQATATEGGYATLAEFSEALAYFERPNPESIVDAFRQRALLAARRETTSPKPIEAAPASVKPATPVQVTAPRRGISRLAVAAATVAAVACASVWLVGRAAQVATPDVVTVESADRTAPANGPRAKAGSTTKAAAPLSQSDGGTPAAAPAEAAEPAPRAARDTGPELLVTAETVSYRYPEFSSPTPALIIAETTAAGPAISAGAGAGDEDLEAPSDRIYSRTDSQVTQPVNLFPRFPPEPAGARIATRTILELTIATDGMVERVRMLTAPRNIHEFMLLSAAKAWRFEPARIGGRAVRYRHTMLLALP